MNAQAFIEQARAAGVELRLVSGKVQARGTRDDVTRLIEPLRQQKMALLRWLTQKSNDYQVHPTGPAPDSEPDHGCSPQSAAMTGREIDIFTLRLARIADIGLPAETNKACYQRLLQRDRERDDRTLCLECRHLGGVGPSSWRCGNWRQAGIAIRARDADLSSDLVMQLQRCDGFKPHICSDSVVVTEPQGWMGRKCLLSRDTNMIKIHSQDKV